MTNNIGLHLHLKQSLQELIQEVLARKLNTFQFFLLSSTKNGRYIRINQKDKQLFSMLCKNLFVDVYIHCSYWINPAAGNRISFYTSKKILKKELDIAQELSIGNVVLHPGTVNNYKASDVDFSFKEKAFDNIAKMLNSVLKYREGIKILLENIAHSDRSIGGNLKDFISLKNRLDYPEKIGFCVDFAHAFAYGYDLSETENFVQLLEKTLGIDNIKLLHFNDSMEKYASRKDKHAFPGKGFIGTKVLKDLINHHKLKGIPKIIEPPSGGNNYIYEILDKVNSWQSPTR
jgi:deoxyribonuclease IV